MIQKIHLGDNYFATIEPTVKDRIEYYIVTLWNGYTPMFKSHFMSESGCLRWAQLRLQKYRHSTV